MEQSRSERRHVMRVMVSRECELTVNASVAAQVLAISRGGVTLASRTALSVGDRADLMVTLGGRTFTLAIEVRRVTIDAVPRGNMHHRAGAAFLALSAEQRLVLDQVLGPERL